MSACQVGPHERLCRSVEIHIETISWQLYKDGRLAKQLPFLAKHDALMHCHNNWLLQHNTQQGGHSKQDSPLRHLPVVLNSIG
jgi:hypothetical protein